MDFRNCFECISPSGLSYKRPNASDYTLLSSWYGADVEFLAWIADAANISLELKVWDPSLTDSKFFWNGILEMVMFGINGSQTSSSPFMMSEARKKLVLFSGEYILEKVVDWFYIIIPDAKYAHSETWLSAEKILHAFRLMDDEVWLVLFGFLIFTTAMMVLALSMVGRKASILDVVEFLLRNIMNSDAQPLKRRGKSKTEVVIMLIWALLSLMFVAFYTGSVMVVTSIIVPFSAEANRMEEWVEMKDCSGEFRIYSFISQPNPPQLQTPRLPLQPKR